MYILLEKGDMLTAMEKIFQLLAFSGEAPELLESLKKYGVLSPILVSKKNSNLIVDGEKRLFFARQLNISNLNYIYLDYTDLDLLELKLTNVSHRLGLMETVTIVSLLLKDLKLSRKEICSRFLPLLGFTSQEAILRQLLLVGELPLALQHFCYAKRFSLKQCFHLTRFSDDVLNAFSNFLDQFSFTASTLSECIELCNDYVRKESVSVDVMFEKIKIKELLNSYDSIQFRTDLLRNRLKETSYPMLFHRQKQIENELSKLPSTVKIKWDEALEDKYLSISFTIRKSNDYQHQLNHLTKPDNQAVIEQTLKLL